MEKNFGLKSCNIFLGEQVLMAGKYHLSKLILLIFLIFNFHSSELYSDSIFEEAAKKDLAIFNENGFLIIPHAYFTPETNLAGGFVFISYFHTATDFPLHIRPSSVATTFTYTQNKQFMWQLFPELYMDNEKYHIVGEIQYMNYPNKFYGIGRDTPKSNKENYTSDRLWVISHFQREIFPRFYSGLVYQYDWSKVKKFEDGGLIASGKIPGSEKSVSSGMGIDFAYDDRDNTFNPMRGGFYQFSFVSFQKFFGSDYSFTRYTLDLRKSIFLGRPHTLALQAYMNITNGKTPFEMLSVLGGRKLMRGFFEGRYRDDDMIVLQAEYRMSVWSRFGLAAFIGYGDVAHTIAEFRPLDFKIAAGGGIRYSINPNEKVNLRIDYGYSRDLSAVYVTIGEAY